MQSIVIGSGTVAIQKEGPKVGDGHREKKTADKTHVHSSKNADRYHADATT